MIKLVIEIKEENMIETNEFRAIGSNIHVQEIGKYATENEKQVSNILKKRLNIEEKIQIEGYSKQDKLHLKEDLLELLKCL